MNTLVFTSEKSFHITERAAGATASLSDVYKQHLVRKSAPRPPCTRALALRYIAHLSFRPCISDLALYLHRIRLSESYAKFMDIRRERIAAELSVLNKMKERTSVPHRVRTDLQTPPPGTPHVLRP